MIPSTLPSNCTGRTPVYPQRAATISDSAPSPAVSHPGHGGLSTLADLAEAAHQWHRVLVMRASDARYRTSGPPESAAPPRADAAQAAGPDLSGTPLPVNSGDKKARVGARALEIIEMSLQALTGTLFSGSKSNGHQSTAAAAPSEAVGTYQDGGKTSFTKHLRWKMKTTDIEQMSITPDMAREMLAYNTDNRPLTQSTVKKYARQMIAGEWRLTREMILFSPTRLIQGQHRLTACVESGASFPAYVAFGEPDANFAFIDIGKPRGPDDIFAIHGVPNYTAMSSASRWVMAYDREMVSHGSSAMSTSPTPDELYRFYLEHQKLQDSMHVSAAFKESKLAAPSMMAAMHYICARKNRAQADEFFLQVGSGVGLSGKNSPAFKLRKRLIDNYASAAGKLSYLVIAAYTIKAWNAMRDNRPLGVLKWRGDGAPNEAFPRAQ